MELNGKTADGETPDPFYHGKKDARKPEVIGHGFSSNCSRRKQAAYVYLVLACCPAVPLRARSRGHSLRSTR